MMSSTNAGNVRNGHGCYRLMWWYYVLALNLFFGEAYEEVMRQLVNGLRFLGNWRYDWTVPSTSALSETVAQSEDVVRACSSSCAASAVFVRSSRHHRRSPASGSLGR